MRIAAPFDGANIFQHFGKTQSFRIYDVDGKTLKFASTKDTGGKGHGMLVEFLKDEGIDILICGGIGEGAQNALKDAGIKFYAGVSGNPDDAVKSFLNGTLTFNPSPKCNHHEHNLEGDCQHG